MKICFVILHYLTSEDTINCVNSILKMKDYKDASIVIVDNASKNGSIEKVQEIFYQKENLYFLINDKNLGFAKGNNIGYKFAKQKLMANMIIISNNDIIFEDKLFISKIEKSFYENNFYVLGPNIVSLVDKQHQNPMEVLSLTNNKAKKEQIRYTILYLLSKIGVYEFLKSSNRESNRSNSKIDYNKNCENIILHGSCMVFSQLFINEMDFAFFPETFLYMEEMILFEMCSNNGFKMYYDSSIKVLHKEDSATNKKTETTKHKREFVFKNMILSLGVYRKVKFGKGNILSENNNIGGE